MVLELHTGVLLMSVAGQTGGGCVRLTRAFVFSEYGKQTGALLPRFRRAADSGSLSDGLGLRTRFRSSPFHLSARY